jgi:MoxR-like ATPase
VPIPDHVLTHILTLTHRSRPTSEHADDFVRRYVEWGAGPRASQTLTLAVKALAVLRGQPAASVEEVNSVAHPALRHRIVPSYNATGEGIDVETIIDHLLTADE